MQHFAHVNKMLSAMRTQKYAAVASNEQKTCWKIVDFESVFRENQQKKRFW